MHLNFRDNQDQQARRDHRRSDNSICIASAIAWPRDLEKDPAAQ